MKETLDIKTIETLRDLPQLIPVLRDSYENWSVRIFDRQVHDCRNYLSPNRRDFYKILMISGDSGIFTLGLNRFVITEPTIIFLHPNDIISWQYISGNSAGYYVLFKKSFLAEYQALQATIERFELFSNKARSVIRIDSEVLLSLNQIWDSMISEETVNKGLGHDAIQAYIQLLMITSMRNAKFPSSEHSGAEYSHIHKFFDLLEVEASHINHEQPIRLRTAKEFASSLKLHPNYLNRLLKKYTGQSVSTHIKGRLLEESKALLLHTSWNLEEISYSLGFSDPPNFTVFFKKNTGLTPNEFRKNYV